MKTFILASSSGTIAVSEDKEIVDETYPPPMDLISRFAYYASKFYQEKTALENFDGKGIKLVILNPSLLLGTGDERLSSTKPVLDFLARKIPFTPSGGLNFVDARDTATAFINALEKGRHKRKISARCGKYDVCGVFRRGSKDCRACPLRCSKFRKL